MTNSNSNLRWRIVALVVVILVIIPFLLSDKYSELGLTDCPYTEVSLPVPSELIDTEFITVVDTYTVPNGKSKLLGDNTCLEKLGAIERYLINPFNLNYFEEESGHKLIPAGSTFKIVGIVARTKYGVSTVDSGKGPVYFLILEDETGALYTQTTATMGINQDEGFLAFKEPPYEATDPDNLLFLHSVSFEGTPDHEGPPSLMYTGELIELPPNSYENRPN